MSTKGFFVLDQRNAELRASLEESKEAATEFERRYLMSWLYHDNALDGLVLTMEEIRLALEHHVVADPTAMTVITAVRNPRDALQIVEREAKTRRGKITVQLLHTLYDTLLDHARANEKEKGVLRKEMPLHRVYVHDFLPFESIEEELEKWAKRINGAEYREQHPIRRAANAHWHLLQIFPFAEHNGRIGRLVQAFFLLQAGYFPPVIHARERMAYYQTLRQSPSSLRNLLAASMEATLESSSRHVESLGIQRAG
jgi:Fic family protein